MQREIQNAAYLYQREIETKERIIVGVNQFTSGGEPPQRYPEGQSRNRAQADAQARPACAPSAIGRRERRGIAQVEASARDGANLMPPIIDAVRAWCTLGEISDAMRRVFGEYQPVNRGVARRRLLTDCDRYTRRAILDAALR